MKLYLLSTFFVAVAKGGRWAVYHSRGFGRARFCKAFVDKLEAQAYAREKNALADRATQKFLASQGRAS